MERRNRVDNVFDVVRGWQRFSFRVQVLLIVIWVLVAYVFLRVNGELIQKVIFARHLVIRLTVLIDRNSNVSSLGPLNVNRVTIGAIVSSIVRILREKCASEILLSPSHILTRVNLLLLLLLLSMILLIQIGHLFE